MTLRFMYGRAGNAHEKTLADQIKSDQEQKPNDKYFYLVPNHIKFKSEINLLRRLSPAHQSTSAQMNVQVLSLTRLAWYFLKQTPQLQLQQLSDSGANMLLYQIIRDHRKELQLFQSEVNQPGFVLKLTKQISEMRTGQISAETLGRIAQIQNNWNLNLQQKMHDFIIVYHAFERATKHRYVGKADTLDLLSRYLRQSSVAPQLKRLHFYISGFSQFTAQEENLVKLLIMKSASVLIDLDLDHLATHRLPKRPNLFYQPALLYYRLYHFAQAVHVKVYTDLAVKYPRVSRDLLHLDRFWSQVNQRHSRLAPEPLANRRSIQVIEADNRYAEVARVALKIRQMVATGRYRYSDFLIMTRHLDRFQNVIRPIFRAQQIPVFCDLQKSMASHPLVRLLAALFSIDDPDQQLHYRYQDIMNLLKTELLIPRDSAGNFMSLANFRDALALTENVILANGYFSDRNGNRWTQDKDWRVTDFTHASDFGKKPVVDHDATRKVNVIRKYVKEILPLFYQKMAHAKTGRDAARILYQFLVRNGVADRLQMWRQQDMKIQSNRQNDLTAANEIGQVWDVLCRLLDDFVQILGSQPFHLKDFWGLLKAGFTGSVYSQIPSTLDQVIISESRIVQTDDYKVVFMIGSTDDVMPDRIVNDSFFNDQDRAAIQPDLNRGVLPKQNSCRLNDGSEEQMAEEPYLNYLAFMSASQQIIFTYSLNRDDNTATQLKLSPYVKWIEQHFRITEQRFPATAKANANALPFVGTPITTLRHLVQAAYDSGRSNRVMGTDWCYIYQELRHQSLTDRLLSGLDYDNQPQPLDRRIVTDLYGKNINSSISQLEQFYNDPFEYFLRFGLRLKPRQLFVLSPAGTGSFYHEAMDHFVKLINQRHWDLAELTGKEITKGVDVVASQILQDLNQPQYQILNSSFRMKFIRQQLVHVICRMVLTLRAQSHYTPMRPKWTEVSFGLPGRGIKLKPLNFWTDSHHHHQIRVHGRIDRIDMMRSANEDFWSIIDYKSSQHAFDYGPIYSGNEMQMMTYLAVLQKNLYHLDPQQRAAVAGALYSWIHLPNVKPQIGTNNLEAAILKKQKYQQALLVNDPRLLKSLDMSLKDSKSSLVYPLRRKKNGDMTKRTAEHYLISRNDLSLILQRTQDLIRHAGHQIYQGDIRLSPVRFNNRRTLLQYSPYRSIMQFDPLLQNNKYRNVDNMGLEQLVDLLRKQSTTHGEEA